MVKIIYNAKRNNAFHLAINIIFCSVTSTLLYNTTYAEKPCTIPPAFMKAAVTYRKLPEKQPVECVRQDQDEVKAFIAKSFEEQATPQELTNDIFLYRTLGLISEDFNYKEELVKLYTSQVGGYYDPKKKRYAMPTWLPDLMQQAIAVHELTHALQDQHFNLTSFMDNKTHSVDQLMAHQALVEGDATAVMTDFSHRELDQSKIEDLANVDSLVLQQTLSMMFIPSFQKAPRAISYSMLFPYSSGLRFVHSLLRKDSYKAVDKAFLKPPQTTEEILHPEKYGSAASEFRIIPASEVLQHAGLLTNTPIDYSTVFGEFNIGLFLATVSGPEIGSQTATGWGGDRLLIVTDQQKRGVVLYTEWDSTKSRDKYKLVVDKVATHLGEKSGVTLKVLPVNEKGHLLVVWRGKN
jgi:hypothetical protein